MEREIRVPRQKRSIEKKNKIIDAAYKIFSEKGYNSTNTIEIAKEAGIATGSVYAYFKDKKDILLETLNRCYGTNFMELIINKFEEIPKDEDLLDEDLLNVLRIIIRAIFDAHDISRKLHDEVMALTFLDTDVRSYLHILQQKLMDKVLEQLQKRNIKVKNEREKMFLIVSSVDALCHECIYNETTHFDKDIAIDECAYMIKCLLTCN